MRAAFWTLTRSPRATPSSMNASRPITQSWPTRAPVLIWARFQMLVLGPTDTSDSMSAEACTRAEGSITDLWTPVWLAGCSGGPMAVVASLGGPGTRVLSAHRSEPVARHEYSRRPPAPALSAPAANQSGDESERSPEGEPRSPVEQRADRPLH